MLQAGVKHTVILSERRGDLQRGKAKTREHEGETPRAEKEETIQYCQCAGGREFLLEEGKGHQSGTQRKVGKGRRETKL